jgi:hypothetical protein
MTGSGKENLLIFQSFVTEMTKVPALGLHRVG